MSTRRTPGARPLLAVPLNGQSSVAESCHGESASNAANPEWVEAYGGIGIFRREYFHFPV